MAVAVAAVAVAAAVSDATKVKDLARDPATLSSAPASDGVLTWLSAFAWSATVAVVLLAAWLLGRSRPGSRRVRFLVGMAILSTILAVDDVFLVHERLVPRFGIAEEVLFATYVGGFLLFVRAFRDVLVETDLRLLGSAIVFFAATLLVAYGPDQVDPPFWLLPDTYTFLGVGAWLAYHLHTVVSWLEEILPDAEPGAAG